MVIILNDKQINKPKEARIIYSKYIHIKLFNNKKKRKLLTHYKSIYLFTIELEEDPRKSGYPIKKKKGSSVKLQLVCDKI